MIQNLVIQEINHLVTEGDHMSVITGTSSSETLSGPSGDDTITGGLGNDTIAVAAIQQRHCRMVADVGSRHTTSLRNDHV